MKGVKVKAVLRETAALKLKALERIFHEKSQNLPREINRTEIKTFHKKKRT